MCRALETIAALDITGALAPLFASQYKRFTAEIQYNIERYGNEESLRQLISILMDNAVKYTPEGRDIHFSLKKQPQPPHCISKQLCSHGKRAKRPFHALLSL